MASNEKKTCESTANVLLGFDVAGDAAHLKSAGETLGKLMATNHHVDTTEHQSLMHRMFVKHPKSLGMSWAHHGVGAIKIGAELIGAGCACLVHAVVPGIFTDTAGKTVARMHDHMTKRRASAADPDNWPEYEI